MTCLFYFIKHTMPDKLIGFTQSAYPALYLPPMRITKRTYPVMSPQSWVKLLMYPNFKGTLSLLPFHRGTRRAHPIQTRFCPQPSPLPEQ